MKYLLSKEDIKNKSIDEINEIINNEFKFDQFKWQQENNVVINEPFRADYLHKILYKCPHCLAENKTVGKGITLTCTNCNNTYELTENGYLKNISGNETIFDHIPTWNTWQRNCVKEEIINNTYLLDEDVYDLELGLTDTYKWYDYDEEMLELSKQFPETVFCLYGDGEESMDVWYKYYKNGKSQYCPAKVTFDEYDESKLN